MEGWGKARDKSLMGSGMEKAGMQIPGFLRSGKYCVPRPLLEFCATKLQLPEGNGRREILLACLPFTSGPMDIVVSKSRRANETLMLGI